MKKLTFFSILVLSFICINCKTNEEDYSKALMCYKNTQNTSSDYINRLEFLSGNNNFSITETEMESILISFLQYESDSRNSDNTISIKKIDQLPISVSILKSNDSRNLQEQSESDTIPLYLYSTKNENLSTEGFAITSTDLRIGSIIAVVDNGSFEYFKTTDFMPIFISKLYDYTNEIIKTWIDLNTKSEDRGITDLLIIEEKNKQATAYTYSNFRTLDINTNCLMKTEWGQNSPYCDYARKKLNRSDIVAGCTPIALAQILTQLEITDPNTNYPYNWNLIKSKTPCNSIAEEQIGYMLYKLGTGMGSSYGTTTSTSILSASLYLLNNGYTFNSYFYNFDEIKNSIDNGCPVLISGSDQIIYYNGTVYPRTGHSWVIDAYKNCEVTLYEATTQQTFEITDYFVHCNMGWEGLCNGYYRNDIFYTRNIPEPDYQQLLYENGQRDVRYIFGFPYLFEEYLRDYYKYNVTIISNLNHN